MGKRWDMGVDTSLIQIEEVRSVKIMKKRNLKIEKKLTLKQVDIIFANALLCILLNQFESCYLSLYN